MMSRNNLDDIFYSPYSHRPLIVDNERSRLYNTSEEYIQKEGVFSFLAEQNQEYEGAYLNKIKYVPRMDMIPFTIPLWMMTSGYVWEVRKQFQKGAVLCELGCASGVNYFGHRYQMIGLDFSFQSLKEIENYQYRIQANALSLPFGDDSLDGIIASFFWEHISPDEKVIMLKEFRRVLKKNGKVVMLYDVTTQNRLIKQLKDMDLAAYEELFLHGDYHIGYETLQENQDKFSEAGFNVIKHFGLERTFWQGNSVYTKLSTIPSWYGRYSTIMKKLTSNRLINYLNMFILRIVDVSIGRLWDKKKSRIAISVLQK